MKQWLLKESMRDLLCGKSSFVVCSAKYLYKCSGFRQKNAIFVRFLKIILK